MYKLFFSLPKYEDAMNKFYDEFTYNLHMQDELLRRFPPRKVSHSGTTRFLSKPEVLEAPYKRHENTTNAEIEIITQTDVIKFKDFLLDLFVPILDKLREHTIEIINQTCNATGNKVDAVGQNVWDAYIQAIEKVEMGFDSDGSPIFLIHPPEIYEKLSKTEPTIDQRNKVEEIFRRKREEYNLKRGSRRLSKSSRVVKSPLFTLGLIPRQLAAALLALKGRNFLVLENSWFCRFGQKFSGEYPVSLLRGSPKITNFQFIKKGNWC